MTTEEIKRGRKVVTETRIYCAHYDEAVEICGWLKDIGHTTAIVTCPSFGVYYVAFIDTVPAS